MTSELPWKVSSQRRCVLARLVLELIEEAKRILEGVKAGAQLAVTNILH